eukprot:CAMPEP_0113936466 /NCGR_PEP_ID=MMETSP1339-20121228/3375_1 /TAXON_ID=94617 /ORGANISM="Fibrocapsa japonica" /LENGTH=74 /DNA_ID=CAMNT_0000938957 /DNA_START=64 /DNA_END=288 /DNA_ORIENTATION=- /assembly_acc=CAM_ASM_000762
MKFSEESKILIMPRVVICENRENKVIFMGIHILASGLVYMRTLVAMGSTVRYTQYSKSITFQNLDARGKNGSNL